MTKATLIQKGFELNRSYSHYSIDTKRCVRDYEVVQIEKTECCTYWRFVEFKDFSKKLQIMKSDTNNILFHGTDFYAIPNELLDLEVKGGCIDSLNGVFTMYV